MSKIENQQMVADKTNFLIDEQIRLSILSLEPEWQAKNITFDLDEMASANYYGSKELIAQVWQNLISNAIKFSSDDGKITISVKKDNHDITVKITDEGIGMSEETIKHIYDKFYQGDSSHSSAGNGLGLALVKRIITISGGKIEIQSELNKGTTFTVIL